MKEHSIKKLLTGTITLLSVVTLVACSQSNKGIIDCRIKKALRSTLDGPNVGRIMYGQKPALQ